MVLPMIEEGIRRKILSIQRHRLPLDIDALKDIREYTRLDRNTIDKALLIQLPLQNLHRSFAKLKDQLQILKTELLDLKEQQRLGMVKDGVKVKHLETEEEKQQQLEEISKLTIQVNLLQAEYNAQKKQLEKEEKTIKAKIRGELDLIEKDVLAELVETSKILLQFLSDKKLPDRSHEFSLLKDLILKRQLLALKDIANHALVVEQSAIAPLTMGIIHYRRHREIQEAMTTFINDEAKHSATFRRFLAEKLDAREFISSKLIAGANRYMWLARFMPGAGLFLAVIVEAIGAAVLEFFGKEEYMPDALFCSICKIISDQDEVRHLGLCVDMYNELFRTGYKWERIRNKKALEVIMRSVYGDKSEDHRLVQAFRAFGVESEVLYRHIVDSLCHQLSRISMYVEPDTLRKYMGHASLK